MKEIWFKAVPFDKKLVTLALESGVDGIIVEQSKKKDVAALGRTNVVSPEEFTDVCLKAKEDEETAVSSLRDGKKVVLTTGWEIIPVENILAQSDGLGVEVSSLDQALLAAGILEHGVDFLVVLPEAAPELKDIVSQIKLAQGMVQLQTATVTAVEAAGLGHRVCVDTLSMLKRGQGMLVGNSSAFTFLVHAETESNPYVAARPFRVNAGAVHAYALMPGDKTSYLEELTSGREVLVVSADGSTSIATVGRSKVEVRPMLLIRARLEDGTEGAIFLQNAETIRLVTPAGEPVSVVNLQEGDQVLVKADAAGRHFGMRIREDIKEA
ncbi:3-dehydroquinate synthase II family protein [Oceanidesulfovibrio indonesiensis]|uniref:3-dehydroquinate synthase II family protein n=1 Tax=Oceanidesulfovibrio indonesiensis TaxID=54767 RepID=A0A7M3MFX4_9BACT|nr:3-dehydroquinate synthase II family protein [Oceanidesulfovibrio indonesiensis]TVM17653.1 3-dehydroquinate synthase II family protein [Oceanidesulfovibrio indonesiensis]